MGSRRQAAACSGSAAGADFNFLTTAGTTGHSPVPHGSKRLRVAAIADQRRTVWVP